ncbi:MAG: FlaD/FlaE family flagellar protein [Haloarculaceae archaeon]
MGGPIDPIEYDVAELRELARVRGDRYVADGFLWTELPESFPPTEGAAEHDRPVTWTGSLEERQKPYLREIPETERGQRVVREWIRGLVERAGSGAVVEALAYYESLGWLTEAVREELEGYLLAVGYQSGGSLEDLTRADHVESLARTARLACLGEPVQGGEPASITDGEGKPDPDDDTADGEATDPDGDGRENRSNRWEGGVAGLGDQWLNTVVSEFRIPNEGVDYDGDAADRDETIDPDGDETADRDDGGTTDPDDDPDSGFEFGTQGA